jgi:hypothetical protein
MPRTVAPVRCRAGRQGGPPDHPALISLHLPAGQWMGGSLLHGHRVVQGAVEDGHEGLRAVAVLEKRHLRTEPRSAALRAGRLVCSTLRTVCRCHRITSGFVSSPYSAFGMPERGFCPSCTGRRMADTAARLTDNVFPMNVPVRQWVLSLPFDLRMDVPSVISVQWQQAAIVQKSPRSDIDWLTTASCFRMCSRSSYESFGAGTTGGPRRPVTKRSAQAR